jgi:hypothetical protein
MPRSYRQRSRPSSAGSCSAEPLALATSDDEPLLKEGFIHAAKEDNEFLSRIGPASPDCPPLRGQAPGRGIEPST